MAKTQNMIKTDPSKNFFVHMLTRDIELSDAILDLLDNCIDGVVRQTKTSTAEKPFLGFYTHITLDSDSFTIEDNCGGIELDIALNYAFKFGREQNDTRDKDAKTIGMYGIGMKRAIFKIGMAATVKTFNNVPLEVEIPYGWEGSPDWELPYIPMANGINQNCTNIRIEKLRQGVQEKFSTDNFKEELFKSISKHYSRYIEKGFEIRVNNSLVGPRPIKLFHDQTGSIKPYVYKETRDNIEISIVFGFNSPPKGIEGDDFGKDFDEDRSEDEAGWTILCNDRAVVFNDKTTLTGWGDGAAKYHPQFVVLSGVVEFNSTDATELPITTTKRGVDTSSFTYIRIKKLMISAMKHFMSYTNQWKNEPREMQKVFFATAAKLGIPDIIACSTSIEKEFWTNKIGDNIGGIEFFPKLPPREGARPDTRRISFTRKISDIRKVSAYLNDGDEDFQPHEIGEKAFDKILGYANEEI